ncbi:MAG TPA: ATP-dependent sacrificial sulfur transferase LarE, partial [Methanoregulaceae archaeon]|nr:ATP-dependent sacrificial sulfur transferase LarE [Methanoregulaceae archaeon]
MNGRERMRDPPPRTDPNDDGDAPGPKLTALREELLRIGPLLVSYSGGVDSSLLAVVAREVLGGRMACAFLDGPLVPRSALAAARAIAREHDLPLVVLPFDPLGTPAIAANPEDRCYLCKRALIPLLFREAASRGLGAVVDGVNCSDLSEHRPGLKACAELGVLHPFVTAGITKPEIRKIARSLGLSFAEKPSAACLASRVPYREPLTPGVLARVEAAEEALIGLGLHRARVRAHGPVARIEVPVPDLPSALALAPRIVRAVKSAGFTYVTLDL